MKNLCEKVPKILIFVLGLVIGAIVILLIQA